MAKKTAIRALAKYLPLSVEFSDAVQVDHDGGSNVDYASFAMNPDDGPTIEGEYTEAEDADETPAAEETVEGKAEDAAPAKEEKPKADGKKDDAKPKDADSDVPEKHRKVHADIMNDLNDGAPVDATKAFYAEQLTEMEKDAPDFHKQVIAEMDDYASEAG